MTKIVTRLMVVGILIALCVGVMIASVIWINQRGIKDGYVINIAGKQRMLTQKIAKEVFLINSQNKKNFAELNLGLKEFEENLNLLRFGSKEQNIKATKNATINHQLAVINKKWEQYKRVVNNFKDMSFKIYGVRKFLGENNQKMLQLSDGIVKEMVKARLSGEKIDLAGKQRMLTQKMAYQLLRYANQWDNFSYQNFKETYSLYDKVISDFYANKEYKEQKKLYKSIQNAYIFWQEYSKYIQKILQDQEELVEDLREIKTLNRELLAQMDWAVFLYSETSIKTRSYLEKFQYTAAIVMLLLALYSLKILLSIKGNLNDFLMKTKMLAQGNITKNLAKEFCMEGENELSQATKNLSEFFIKFDLAKETSKCARDLSIAINEEIENLSEQIKEKLKVAHLSQAKIKQIQKSIDLGEDIAIQSSEQIMVAAQLLEKLHIILQEVEKSCKNSQS